MGQNKGFFHRLLGGSVFQLLLHFLITLVAFCSNILYTFTKFLYTSKSPPFLGVTNLWIENFNLHVAEWYRN